MTSRSRDDDLRGAIADGYCQGQAALASGAIYEDIHAAWPHYDANYGDLLADVSRAGTVLEVGSGHGSLIAWLRSQGFTSVSGIDVSPGDVAFANAHLGQGVVIHGDFLEFLEGNDQGFDVIVMKAVLEHIPKPLLLRSMDALARGLRRGGMLVVEVPNMDWLMASHERYMDLTHEVGFTPQSVHALLGLRFADIQIRGSRLVTPTRAQRLFRPLLVRLLRGTLYVLGEGANGVLFSHRSLVCTAKEPRL